MVLGNIFSLFSDFFFLIDYVFAGIILAIVILLFIIKKISKFGLFLFFLGFLVGLLWEIPLGLARELDIPIAILSTSKPLSPFPIHSFIHSIWDGGLFLIGAFFIWTYSKEEYFNKFNVKELLILEIWGQLQCFIIELSSILGGGWEYIPYWWNPVLFTINGHNFTLFPQLVWIIASIVYYILALKLKPKING
ncbi:MAG: hypothetical protein GF317_13895 [Candidatus Lokiarchaeota archaeon]|nr:hypothetical protein [Candidatus Lokiarchaeota archaeon]MBD3200717.1 hypothetical protein [Candidatus Lokiarchaeota archaeon]